MTKGARWEIQALRLEVVEVDDGTMPFGHDWAVVALPERTLLLVRGSVMDEAQVDPALVNAALARTG